MTKQVVAVQKWGPDFKYNPKDVTHRRRLAAMLIPKLISMGFEMDPPSTGLERVYRHRVTYKNGEGPRNTFVKVYTTIPYHKNGTPHVRNEGADAIRVVAIFDDGKARRGLVKEKRVFRTGTFGAIVERMYERARNAYKLALARPRCSECGAPTFVSNKGNNVCAALCWREINQSLSTSK